MKERVAWLALSIILVVISPRLGLAAPSDGERKLELIVQTGHTSKVNSASFSPDGKRIVTASDDNSAIIWDAEIRTKLRALVGPTSLNSASFSPDGKRIVTASVDKTAIVWDAESGKKLHTLEGHKESVNSASFSPDGKRLVTASVDKTAIVWDTESGKKLYTLQEHTNSVNSASYSPDGKRIVTASGVVFEVGTVILWDAETGTKLLKLEVPNRVNSASYSPDGKRIVTASHENSVIVWNAETGMKLLNLEGHTKSVKAASYSPDGKRIVSASWDETSIVWDAETGMKLLYLVGLTKSVNSVSYSPDGKRIVTASGGFAEAGNAVVCDAANGKALVTLDGRTDYVSSSSYSPDGKRIVTSSGENPVTIWDVETGSKFRTLAESEYVSSASYSPDGKRMVTALFLKAIVWDAESGKRLRTLEGHTKYVRSPRFSPDGKWIVTASDDKTAIVWDAETGTKLCTLQGHSGNVNSASFSPDGKQIVTASDDNKAILWDAETGKKLRTFEVPTRVHSASYSPDGKQIVTTATDKNMAIVWDAETGTKLRNLEGHNAIVMHASYSPDGKQILTASGQIFTEGTAILWDSATGRKLHTFEGHTDGIKSVSYSPDGNRIITASWDRTIRLWDAQTGQNLCALISLENGKEWLVVTPDGYFDGSENGSKYVSFRISGTNDLVPLERYRKQFERPGLLAKIFAGNDFRGTDAVKQDLPPKVRITSPAANFNIKDSKLSVEAEAASQGEYPVTQFRLLVNGRPHTTKFGLLEVTEPKIGKATAKWEIELEPGDHSIEVLAYTTAVFAKSSPVAVKYVGGDSGGVELPTLYILAVGVSKYEKQPLDFAHRDAEEVAKAFQTHSKPLFKKIETKVLTDEVATKDNIMDGLDWLRKSMTQKDFGIFFFAGHGVKDNRDSVYFMPVNGDREKLARTAIDGDVLSKELTSTVGQLLVILDACHAGAVGSGKSRGLSDNLLKDLSSEEKGIAIMCSASGREEAGESREHQHGKFTVALLEGLKGTGDGKDAKIGLSDGAVYFKKLDSYVTDRVKVLSKGEQHPVTCIPRNFRDFPLSKP